MMTHLDVIYNLKGLSAKLEEDNISINDEEVEEYVTALFKAIELIKKPTSEWEDFQDGQWVYARCKHCTSVRDNRTPYCPMCGAIMTNWENKNG